MNYDVFTQGEKLAYAAGLIDGEGCVFIHGIPSWEPRSFGLRVYIGMTNSAPLFWMKDNFGGTVRVATPDFRGRRWKKAWIWSACSDTAAELLERIKPCLKVKHVEAEIGLLLHYHLQLTKHLIGTRQPIPNDIIQVRKLLWEECRAEKRYNG